MGIFLFSIEIAYKYAKNEVFKFYTILVPVQESQTEFYTSYRTNLRKKLIKICWFFFLWSCLETYEEIVYILMMEEKSGEVGT